ncbi:integrase [Mucilaginibacter sp. SG564]|nr:integrase [Mucilaginibacter sp. SG564]
MTFHIARHTFATTVTLNNGVPIETVSKMLGHADIKQTQHYAKMQDYKVSKDMLLLDENLFEKSKLDQKETMEADFELPALIYE